MSRTYTRTICGVVIAAAGEHGAARRVMSKSDLGWMKQRYDDYSSDIPVVGPGHDGPQVGTVVRLWQKGKELVADIALTEQAFNNVRRGGLDRISVGTENTPYRLGHLALLGAGARPAMECLPGIKHYIAAQSNSPWADDDEADDVDQFPAKLAGVLLARPTADMGLLSLREIAAGYTGGASVLIGNEVVGIVSRAFMSDEALHGDLSISEEVAAMIEIGMLQCLEPDFSNATVASVTLHEPGALGDHHDHPPLSSYLSSEARPKSHRQRLFGPGGRLARMRRSQSRRLTPEGDARTCTFEFRRQSDAANPTIPKEESMTPGEAGEKLVQMARAYRVAHPSVVADIGAIIRTLANSDTEAAALYRTWATNSLHPAQHAAPGKRPREVPHHGGGGSDALADRARQHMQRTGEKSFKTACEAVLAADPLLARANAFSWER